MSRKKNAGTSRFLAAVKRAMNTRVRVSDVESGRFGDVEIVHIFDKPGATGYTPEQLGLDREAMTSSRAYDIIAERACRDLLAHRPNRIWYQKICRNLDAYGVRATRGASKKHKGAR